MDNLCSSSDSTELSSMTKEKLEELLRSALRDIDTHFDQIKSILSELRLRGNTGDGLCDVEKAWKDFLEQNSVALYDLDDSF